MPRILSTEDRYRQNDLPYNPVRRQENLFRNGLGPEEDGLEEIIPSEARFRNLVSYRPQAVNWLLHTYVTDTALDEAVDKLERLIQEPSETVFQFHERILSAAKVLGDAFSQQELITKFCRGLLPTIRPSAIHFRNEYTGPNALHKFAERCSSLHESQRALLKAAKRQVKIDLVYTETHSRQLRFRNDSPRHSSFKSARVDNVNLTTSKLNGDESSSSSDCDSDYHSMMNESDHVLLSRVAASHSLGKPGILKSVDVPNFTSVPNTSRARRNERRGALRDMMMPIICYLCMGENHIISRCPHRQHADDPRYLEFFRSNFAKLQKWKQEYLRHINKV